MSNLRDNIKAAHQQLDADLAADDPTAKKFADFFRGELTAARKSVASPTPTGDIWIGPEFDAPTNGVLMLGVSTYGEDTPLTEYIQNWCSGHLTVLTFSRLFSAIIGSATSSATPAEREAFWATIAFANLIDQVVGPTRDHQLTPKHYRYGAAALPDLLQRLKPRLRGALILGREQSKYSAPVLRDAGVPFVVSRHPIARGVPAAELQTAWNELQAKIRND